MLRESPPSQAIKEQIDAAFNGIKTNVIGELDILVEQTQHTLEDLKAKKARNETLVEQKIKESEVYMLEIEKIHARAQALANQLVDITTV